MISLLLRIGIYGVFLLAASILIDLTAGNPIGYFISIFSPEFGKTVQQFVANNFGSLSTDTVKGLVDSTEKVWSNKPDK